MKAFTKRSMTAAVAMVSVLGLSACVTDPNTGNQRISKAAIGGVLGAGAGYLLGDLVGGRRSRTEEIVGAGIGAVAGAGVGYYLDEQEKKLRQQTAGTGVDVTRDGNNLILNMPSEVTFDVDSSIVRPQFQTVLNEVASTLNQYEKTYIDVLGHTDSTGSDAYNQALSERRANAVADYLATRSVVRARMATRGYGETQPIADNSTEAGRAANRRVEIRITPVTQSDVNGY